MEHGDFSIFITKTLGMNNSIARGMINPGGRSRKNKLFMSEKHSIRSLASVPNRLLSKLVHEKP